MSARAATPAEGGFRECPNLALEFVSVHGGRIEIVQTRIRAHVIQSGDEIRLRQLTNPVFGTNQQIGTTAGRGLGREFVFELIKGHGENFNGRAGVGILEFRDGFVQGIGFAAGLTMPKFEGRCRSGRGGRPS